MRGSIACLTLNRQVVTHRVRCRVDLAAGADLAVDVRDVPRDGAQAEYELAGDFRIRPARRDQAQNLDFATCEMVWMSGLETSTRFSSSGVVRRIDSPHAYCI